jgi:hypothetical protein
MPGRTPGRGKRADRGATSRGTEAWKGERLPGLTGCAGFKQRSGADSQAVEHMLAAVVLSDRDGILTVEASAA